MSNPSCGVEGRKVRREMGGEVGEEEFGMQVIKKRNLVRLSHNMYDRKQ